MPKTALFLLVVVLVACPAGVGGAGLAASVFLRANPDSIVADGKSTATISADIRDSSGSLVPDGTLVSFSTSLGTIETTVSTIAGVARARLTAGTAVGTAVVSAWATQGGAVGEFKVELLAPGSNIPRESFITISSKAYLVYDAQKMIVYASGGARIFHKGLSITADEAELDVQNGTLRCRRRSGSEPIKLVRGRYSLDASLIYYQLDEMKGKAIVEEPSGKVERVAFRGADLAVERDSEEIPQTLFDFADLSESAVLIKSSSITVRPREDIRFRRAQVYVDGKRMLSVPLHVLSLSGAAGQGSQYVGWGTNGLRIDLPFYYALSPTSTGSLHLRRGQQAGWGFYSADSGWSLDLVQDYGTGGGGQGEFTLTRLIGGVWGAHWHQSQEFESGSRVYSYLDFPAHKDLFGTVNLTKPLGRANLGVNLYGNKYRGRPGDISTDLFVQSLARPIAGGAASYVMLARTSYTSSGRASGRPLGAGLQTQVFGRPISFGARTSLRNSLSFGYNWGGARSGLTLTGNASLAHQLGRMGSLGLTYSYGRCSSVPGLYGRHRLSVNLLCAPSPHLQAHVFSTYALDQPLSSTFADASYRIRPGWRLKLLQTLQKYRQYRFADTEIALGKEIGENEMLLVWSRSRNRLRIEFAAARF